MATTTAPHPSPLPEQKRLALARLARGEREHNLPASNLGQERRSDTIPPTMPQHPQIIVALDRSSRDDILSLADRLTGIVGMMKVGLQAFTANGPAIVSELRDRRIDVFLDLKLHDIPNTVLHAVQEAVQLGVSMLTVHTSGGGAMLKAAVEGARGSSTRILGVTVLTSHDEASLSEIGVEGGLHDTVLRLATLGIRNGIDGVVASPREIRFLREGLGDELLIVTPGIRAAGEASGDQKRTMSAFEALDAGADYLVIGRPITEAADPAVAARDILAGGSRREESVS